MQVLLTEATQEDTASISALRNAAAETLAAQYGTGHWSSPVSESDVRMRMRTGTVYVVREKKVIIATLAITPKKPWSIDTKLFPPRNNPVYLTAMAVDPSWQRKGIGRACVKAAIRLTRDKFDAIRLDAYDHEAGAGDFYTKCGFNEMGTGVFRGCSLRYFEFEL